MVERLVWGIEAICYTDLRVSELSTGVIFGSQGDGVAPIPTKKKGDGGNTVGICENGPRGGLQGIRVKA